jgi:integrase
VKWDVPKSLPAVTAGPKREIVTVFHEDDAYLCRDWVKERGCAVWRAEIGQRLEAHHNAGNGLSFAEWANTVMEMKQNGQIRTKTWVDYRRQLDDVILPALGSKQLDELSGVDINRFLQHIKNNGTPAVSNNPTPKASLSYGTVDRYYSLIKHILNLAVANGKVPHNVAKITGVWKTGMREKKTTSSEAHAERYFTRDQYKLLLAQFRPDYRLFVRFLCETGARFSEASNLRVWDLDFEYNSATIRFIENDEGELELPKSGRQRPIEVHPALSRALYRLVADRPGDALVFRTSRDKSMIANPNFRRDHWNPAMIKLRQCARHLPERTDKRNGLAVYDPHSPSTCDCLGPMAWASYTPHALRHTYATWMLMGGQPVALVSEQLGHSSIKVTEETYSHLRQYWAKDPRSRLSITLENMFDLNADAVFAV